MGRRTVYGINAVAALLRRNADRVEKIYLLQELGRERRARLDELISRANPVIERVDAETLTRITGTAKHQGAAALIEDRAPLDDREAIDLLQRVEHPLVLILDSVQDPRNFGACLRSADAAGADLVVTARNRNAPLTPVVSKVAAGAAEMQPIAEVANLARFMSALSEVGVWLFGADENADDTIYSADLTVPAALVLGAEGAGLRRLTRERCDRLLRLPMYGSVESLNVSVAAGICLYEARRQRAVPS